MNQASTRSHCIFTVHVCRREPGSATVRRSKLHLVDLAGSDRVSKTGLNGQLLTEAKFINRSLHYLEQVRMLLFFPHSCYFLLASCFFPSHLMLVPYVQPTKHRGCSVLCVLQVIIALSERNRSHVPYRNSMLTSVLRDSLGGNCTTTMIATLAADRNSLDVRMSTPFRPVGVLPGC